MQSSDIPVKFVAPFAHAAGGAYITTPVPVSSPGGSYTGLDVGFPPASAAAGGAPSIKDMNGVLNQTTAWARWIAAAGLVPYDATYQTAIGGYPKGAVLLAASAQNLWVSTAENNATNPDTGGAGWAGLGTPVASGTLAEFAMNTPPAGWLICDGTAISRATYAPLFTAIGTAWGAGDGTTTFNIPDLRGQFTRGWSGSGSVDPGRTFASSQQDAMQGHFHSLPSVPEQGTGFGYTGTSGVNNMPITQTGSPITDGANGTPRTAAETRPVNYAVLKAIKT